MLITGAATLLLCVALSTLLEVHRVIAWIASGSTSSSRSTRHHRNNIHRQRSPAFVVTSPGQPQKQTTPPTVAFLSVFDESTQEGSTSDSPQPAREGFSSPKQEHFFMHPKHKADTKASDEEINEESRVAIDPTVLEEDLLSQHAELESLLLDAKPNTPDLPETSLPEPDASSSGKEVTVGSSTRSVPHFLTPKPKPVPYFLSSKTTETPLAEDQAHTATHLDDDERESTVGDDELSLESIPLEKEEQAVVQKETSVAEGRLKPAASIDRTVYEFNKNLINILYAVISFVYPTSQQQQQQTPPAIDPLLKLFPKKAFTRSSHLSPLLGTEYNEILDTSQPPNPVLDTLPKMVSKATSHLSPLLGKEYYEIQETAYAGHRFEQFYIFETVARIPYFAYLSVLHLRESLGDRGFLHANQDFDEWSSASKKENERRIETMRTHYAQADNELHHLLIMEALGGNKRGIDRLVAHTMAFFYYWFVVLVFLWNEQAAYHLNEVVEDHAYKTYDKVSR